MTACGDAGGGGGGGGDGGYTAPDAITGFTVPGAVSTAIDTAKRTVDVVFPRSYNTGSFTPTISHSGASVFPPSGDTQTFGLLPQYYTYTVTAADGSTAQYTVTARWEPLASFAEVGNHLSTAAEIGDADHPVPLPLAINLSGAGWTDLLSALNGQPKYVALDLSASSVAGMTATEGEFDPDSTNSDGKDKIVTLTLPKAATRIADGTDTNPSFEHFSALTTVNLPEVYFIGQHAFSGCTALESVSIPAAQVIQQGAFFGCTALTTVNLPVTLMMIYGNPFIGCTGLTGISVAPGNPKYKAVDGKILSKDGTTLVAWPAAPATVTTLDASITTIGDFAFFGYTGLTTVSLTSVTTIGDFAFSGCTGLTQAENLYLPAVTTIGEEAFSGCTGLTQVINLPEAATIGGWAFLGCTGLTQVNLPKAASIGDAAFGSCEVLEFVTLTGATTIGERAFYNCIALEELNLPEAASIGEGAFYNCTGLGELKLPKATSIGEGAFDSTGTKSLTITLGDPVTTLGTDMFIGVNSTKLVTLEVPYNSGTAWDIIVGTYTETSAPYPDSWGNGFRGGGGEWEWIMTSMIGSMIDDTKVNSKISLTVTH
jgi:hypothetical protein